MKIGFISSDFRCHSVAYFIDEILSERYLEKHDVHLFHCSKVFDQVSQQFKNRNLAFHHIYNFVNYDGYDYVKKQDLDIAIDLGGHTANSRLLWFANKLAPIQITYLGYPDTTGLTNMDYRITDWESDPEGEDKWYTEKLIRMENGFLAYTVPTDKPEPSRNKETQELVFGSANQLQKLGPETCLKFKEALDANRTAILKLKCRGLHQDEMKDHFRETLKSYEIDTERVVLQGRDESWLDHMRWYNTIDVMLDSYPYNGVTTTFEALSMGIPVVSTYGDVHCSRVCKLINKQGFDVLVSEYEDSGRYLDNIENAVDLIENGKEYQEKRFIKNCDEVKAKVADEFWDILSNIK